jgi:8-amino-7-oxononanoate synthase
VTRFDETVSGALESLKAQNRLRTPPLVTPTSRGRALVNGCDVLLLCSNDYLGFADEAAAPQASGGSGASRLVSGTRTEHREAERALADLTAHEDAVLFSSGYALNASAVGVFAGPGDLILSDALNHASLIDGCRLSRATVLVYPHRDVGRARALAAERRGTYARSLVVSDSIFSMDGDEAPLSELRGVADEIGAGLYVDDAHGLGVFGAGGAGLCSEHGVRSDVYVGTLGKSFGLSGAFVAGKGPSMELIRQRARGYVFSTAPSPTAAHSVAVRAGEVATANGRRDAVLKNAARLRAGLRSMGFPIAEGRTPIIPLVVGSEEQAMAFSAALFAEGVFVQAIRPPTVAPGTSRLRIVPTAAHSEEQIDATLDAFASVRRQLRFT